MYGLNHHVEGEPGLSGNPASTAVSRRVGGWLLAGGLVSGGIAAAGRSGRVSALLWTLAVILLTSSMVAFLYERVFKDRLSHWIR